MTNGMAAEPLSVLSCASIMTASGSLPATSNANDDAFARETLVGGDEDAAKKYSPGVSQGDSSELCETGRMGIFFDDDASKPFLL